MYLRSGDRPQSNRGLALRIAVVSGVAVALFGVLFFWQIPHFMAVAWTYRRD